MKKIYVLCLWVCSFCMQAQNVAINGNGASPDNSAMLDIQSTTKGFLVPRMNKAQRLAILSPAKGLMVFDNESNGFFYFDGDWKDIQKLANLQDVDGDSRVYIEKFNDEDKLRVDLGGTEVLVVEKNANGIPIYKVKNNSGNTLWGNEAGNGLNDGGSFPSGANNSLFGEQAGRITTTGSSNVGVGAGALYSNTIGSYNVAIGTDAMRSNITGLNSVSIGYKAGAGGSGRVNIGNQAGSLDNSDNKLYIDNSSTSAPLVWGDFAENALKINGRLDVFTPGIRNNEIRILPNTTATGDSSTLFLAEDHDGSYGMGLRYDGTTNELQIFGKSLTNILGPFMTVDRDNGDLKMGDENKISLYDSTTATIVIDPAFTPLFSTPRGRISTSELEITGGSDLAEYFSEKISDTRAEAGDIVSISETGDGSVEVSKQAYDHKMVGVVSGANGVNTGLMLGQKSKNEVTGNLAIAISGRVYVKVSSKSSDIKPGDWVTSSTEKGRCMKAEKYAKNAGSILGKALSYVNNGFVLVLINLQ